MSDSAIRAIGHRPLLILPGLTATGFRGVNDRIAIAVAMGALTLFARWGSIGDPDYHVDETFYLLVGIAMHHGAVPYIDIWDRKPPGLFLFYWLLAGIAPSVLAYQIVAIGFVTATGLLVAWLARRWSNRVGAALAGGLYCTWLQPLLGGGGQSPVFYNLFTVSAVVLLVRTRRARSSALAATAALLCGIAVWFKPTAVVEGLFVVGTFVWRERATPRRALALGLLLSGLLAAPTLAGWLWFAAHGTFGAMIRATVLSIFLKAPPNPAIRAHTLRFLVVLTLPLVLTALSGTAIGMTEPRHRPFGRLMLAWSVAALAGFLAVPLFYSHYALTLVPVLAVLGAPVIGRRPVGHFAALLLIGWALVFGQSFRFDMARRSVTRFARVTAVLTDNMPHHTLYVFDGPPWLYQTTGARLITRYVFPEHLSMATEAPAIGTDPLRELDRVLTSQPDAIVITTTIKPDVSRPALAMVRRTIEHDYTFVCALPGADFEHGFDYLVFARSPRPDRRHCPDVPRADPRMAF